MDTTNRDRRDQARWVILLATLAGALYLCWLMLKPFIGVLLWAGVLTVDLRAGPPPDRRPHQEAPTSAPCLCCLLVSWRSASRSACQPGRSSTRSSPPCPTCRAASCPCSAPSRRAHRPDDPAGSASTSTSRRPAPRSVDQLGSRQHRRPHRSAIVGGVVGTSSSPVRRVRDVLPVPRRQAGPRRPLERHPPAPPRDLRDLPAHPRGHRRQPSTACSSSPWSRAPSAASPSGPSACPPRSCGASP
jgi:hypothetical protein